MVGPHAVLLGNSQHLEQAGISINPLQPFIAEAHGQGAGTVLLALNGQPAAVFTVQDPIKATTAQALQSLRKQGIEIVMLTGDHPQTAAFVAEQLGIDKVKANALPQDKHRLVTELRAQGAKVAMAGDGVNDAPALAAADVGIAMGNGSDVALESASVTLLKGDLAQIATALELSRRTKRNIRQNLWLAFGYNAAGIPIAAGILYPISGMLLSPMLAAAAMSLSSLSVIGNALRLNLITKTRSR